MIFFSIQALLYSLLSSLPPLPDALPPSPDTKWKRTLLLANVDDTEAVAEDDAEAAEDADMEI
jgi:hypothetical protein